MKTALALTVAGMALVSATTATAFFSRTDRVAISYEPPKNPAHQMIYERLKERRVLEKLKEFVSPFRLPRTLTIALAGCDGEADAFYGDDKITLCYEYVDELWKHMPAETTAAGVMPMDTVIGPLFDTTLHEFGHALFDMLHIPTFGREEDAADQVAAYIILQLGKEEARRLMMATAYAYMSEVERKKTPPSLKEFADEHGTPAQRAFNTLCIAYGADPKLFEDVVTKGYLPKKRADACEDEYQQVAHAFETLIGPHIDRRAAKNILDKNWLPDTTSRLPRRPGTPPPQSQPPQPKQTP